jgi:hypothetical protein
MKTIDENTIVKTDDAATKARKTANRAIQRYTQSEAAGVQYLRDATGGCTISEDKQAHRNLVLSLVPSGLADAFNNEEKARAEAEARRATEWEAKRAEQERKDAEHDQYRREHADRWLWGGEITRGIKAFYNGYPENERETIWVCPVCHTPEERDAEVAEWIRQHEGYETFDRIAASASSDHEDDDDDEAAASDEPTEATDWEVVNEYFDVSDRWNRDYEYEPWDRESTATIDTLTARIKDALTDNEVGGTLSKADHIDALQRCLTELSA